MVSTKFPQTFLEHNSKVLLEESVQYWVDEGNRKSQNIKTVEDDRRDGETVSKVKHEDIPRYPAEREHRKHGDEYQKYTMFPFDPCLSPTVFVAPLSEHAQFSSR
jgi:hypothetical protein